MFTCNTNLMLSSPILIPKEPFEMGLIIILITSVGCAIRYVISPSPIDIVLTIASWEAFLQHSLFSHTRFGKWLNRDVRFISGI